MRTSPGAVMALCRRCQRLSAHALVELHTWSTLFSIPLHSGVELVTACPMCGVGARIDEARAEHLQAVAATQVAGRWR
jgi:hypothetical protein